MTVRSPIFGKKSKSMIQQYRIKGAIAIVNKLGLIRFVRIFSVHLINHFSTPYKMATNTTARFDVRLAAEQKKLFEQAQSLAHYRSLTEFILDAAQRYAHQIIEKHNSILSSEKDKLIFFDALANPPKPNTALKKAAARYKQKTTKK
jgi:uncharacterized protein (DUF1778 family)